MFATKAQIKYLEILLNDHGYDSAAKRRYFIKEINPKADFLDELTIKEASQAIDLLKEDE